MNRGPHAAEVDRFAFMDHALSMGINFFDTADVYCCLRQGENRRGRAMLAAEVFGGMNLPGSPDVNRKRGLSAREIIWQREASLHPRRTPGG